MKLHNQLELELNKERTVNIDLIPFRSIRENWNKIYSQDKVLTYEKTIEQLAKKKIRKAKKTEREKIKKARLVL